MKDIANLLNRQVQQIAELKAENAQLQQQLKDNTKQVCENIRKFAYDTFNEFGCFDETDLEHILDQIENEKESN